MIRQRGGGQGCMATHRLKQDYMRLVKDPVPYVVAHPLQNNILEWHFAVIGPEDSPYKGGIFHGKLIFPSEFPFKPPSIWMITPNGRFKTNTRLCLSISDFHPDTWNPAWSASTILTGLLSFMLEKNPTLGSIETSVYEKRLLAEKSLEFNLSDHIFCELFPELVEESRRRLSERRARRGAGEAAAGVQEQESRPWQQALAGVLSNVAVVLGFVAFMYTVKAIIGDIIK